MKYSSTYYHQIILSASRRTDNFRQLVKCNSINNVNQLLVLLLLVLFSRSYLMLLLWMFCCFWANEQQEIVEQQTVVYFVIPRLSKPVRLRSGRLGRCLVRYVQTSVNAVHDALSTDWPLTIMVSMAGCGAFSPPTIK